MSAGFENQDPIRNSFGFIIILIVVVFIVLILGLLSLLKPIREKMLEKLTSFK